MPILPPRFGPPPGSKALPPEQALPPEITKAAYPEDELELPAAPPPRDKPDVASAKPHRRQLSADMLPTLSIYKYNVSSREVAEKLRIGGRPL